MEIDKSDLDYNFNMSIRRTRRKKILEEINNQEQAAKEKLFEISYLDEGRLEDNSEILLPDRKQESSLRDDDKKSTRKGRKKVEKKKSNSLAYRDNLILPLESYCEDASSARGHKKSRVNTQAEAKSIINTIQSNRVFVGNIKYKSARTHTDVPNTFSAKKKGGEAMPIIKPKSFVQLEKIERSPSHIVQGKVNEQVTKDRWRLAQLFTNKNADRISYIQIKTKLRRELLGNTEEKLARKYEFFA